MLISESEEVPSVLRAILMLVDLVDVVATVDIVTDRFGIISNRSCTKS